MNAYFRHPSFLLTSILLGVLLVGGLQPAAAQVAQKNQVVSLRDGLKEMLQAQGAASLKKLTVNVDTEKAQSIKDSFAVDTEGSYTVYQGIDADGAVMGAVVIISEQGKEGLIQMLIAFRPDGEIYDVGFTIFGEDKGKSAMNFAYLKQYIGKRPGEPFTLGNDIDGVSGATWTSTSVSNAAATATAVFHTFFVE